MSTKLDDAITEAAREITEGTPPATEEEPTTAVGEETDDVVATTTEEEDADKLSDVEVKEAQILYKLLKDPRQRLNIVAALAQDSGLLQNKPLETPRQVEKAEKGIAALIDEALPEYPGLSKKLGPVIEQIVEAERDSRAADMEQVQLAAVENEVSSELATLARDTKGESRKLENKMAALMQDVSPGPNVSVKQYVRMLYTLATAGSASQKTSVEIADKIRRNANNAPERLKGASGTVSSSVPEKKMNLNESVRWAIEQASKGRTG